MKRLAGLLICLMVLTIPALAFAGGHKTTTTTDPQEAVTSAVQAVITEEANKLAEALGKVYGGKFSSQEIADLNAKGTAYGQISKAYGFAALSGKSVHEILKMRESMGWGQVAHQLGVKVSDVTKSDMAVERAIAKQGDSEDDDKDVKDKDKDKDNDKDKDKGKDLSSGHKPPKGGKH